MALFKENLKSSATVKVLQRCIPEVVISPDALTKMQLFVENCSDEVGWLGTAYAGNKKNSIYIDDMFLFDQEVHSTTTEITPEGLTTFGEKILTQPKGMEIWNNLKVWGHSHVNMSTSPSGQDDNQMETFADGGHNWFIRIIANKRGELRVDLYSYDLGIIYSDLPWEEAISADEMEIENELARLYKMLDEIKKNRTSKFEASIKREIELKVKKKIYATTNSVNTKVIPMSTGQNDTKDIENYKGIEDYNKKKDTNEKVTEKKLSEIEEDRLEDEKDVLYWFDNSTLAEIGECITIDDVEEILDTCGYTNLFDICEVRVIWEAGRKIASENYYNAK